MSHPNHIQKGAVTPCRVRGPRPGPFGLLIAVGLSVLLASVAGARPSLASGPEGSASEREGGVTLPVDSGRAVLAPRFGHRVLREGMNGPDVRVLRSMVSSRALGGRSIGVADVFDRDTRRSVERFQARKGLEPTGVVSRRTSRELVASMPRSGASWYGAPFFGNKTACGQTYTRKIIGVAHKTLPCGTRILIGYRGRFLLTKVIDRGPYAPGRAWDLSNGARKSLGYRGIDRVRHLVVSR